VKYLPLFQHFKAFYQFPKHMIFLVKIVANASLRERPFNLKGGGFVFFSKKNVLIPNVAEKNILILVEGKKII
jgi:hypothetical protein